MNELRVGRRHAVEVEALEQRQHLQQHRALRPGMRLQHPVGAVVEVHRLLHGRQPGRHVLRRQHASVAPPADIHHLVAAAEPVDGLGDEALAPGAPRPLDLGLAPAAAGLRLFQDALVGLGVPPVREEGAGDRHLAVAQIDLGRGRPVLAVERRDRADGGAGALYQRVAVLGVADGRLQHVAQTQRAVVAQHHHEGLERARDAGRQQPGARHDVEAQMAAVVRDRCACRRRPLAADHLGRRTPRLAEHHRHVAARPAQVRLDHLQREGRRDAGIEGVAAALENAHAHRRADPVRGRHHAEGSVDLRARGEGAGIDVGHVCSRLRGWTCVP